MKISAEVREFARLNPQPFAPSDVAGSSENPDRGMAEISEGYRERGDLYLHSK